MKFTTVIACRDGARTLKSCLRSLAETGRTDMEIVVADDGSRDDSASIAASAGARVLRLPRRGRAAALNAALAAAQGEILLFTDADCVVPPDWPARLADGLDRGFDGIGGVLLPSAWTVVECAKIIRYLHEFQNEFILEGAYTRFCLNGNNMAFRRDVLDAAGGFDERYLHGADADLTRRLLAAGRRLLRTPEISVTHLKVDSMRSFLRTFYHRGSAVRFAMDADAVPKALLMRAAFSAFRRCAEDFGRVPALRRAFPEAAWSRAVPAPFAHWLADLWGAAGQRHYHRVFRARDGAA